MLVSDGYLVLYESACFQPSNSQLRLTYSVKAMCANKNLTSALPTCCGGYPDRKPESTSPWADVLTEYRNERTTYSKSRSLVVLTYSLDFLETTHLLRFYIVWLKLFNFFL